jgi:uncharacterized protein (TIGR02271 family)
MSAGETSVETIRLIDRDGQAARLELPVVEGHPALAVLDSGATVRVPPALMIQKDTSTYSLEARFDDLPADDEAAMGRAGDDGASDGGALDDEGLSRPASLHAEQDETVIPVIAEEAHIHKERRVTGKVRLRKIVHHEEQTLDEPLLKERVSMERVAIDQWVDEAPPIRNEGETLVVPVVEEVLVVEKRLRLREEIRLTWHHEEEHEPQHFMVRREEVRVERVPVDEDADEHPDRVGEDAGPSGAGTGREVKP